MFDLKRALCPVCGLTKRGSNPGVLYKTVPFEVKADVDAFEFEGYAATFEEPENYDSWGDIIDPGAFDETIKDHGPSSANPSIKILWQHMWEEPIGLPVDMSTDSKGLYVRGRLSKTSANRDRMILLSDRVIDKLSIGFMTRAVEWLEDVATSWGWPVRKLLKVALFEFSPVTFPANDNAVITSVGDLDEEKRLAMKHFAGRFMETRSGLLLPSDMACTCDLCSPLDVPPAGMVKAIEGMLQRFNKPSSTKAGRVLSKKNENLIRGAADNLDAVLLALDAEDEEEPDKSSAPRPTKEGKTEDQTPPSAKDPSDDSKEYVCSIQQLIDKASSAASRLDS